MATPVLSRLSRVLVWAKAGSASPKVRSSSDNFFIPLSVGGEWETLQQWQAAKSHRPGTGGASQPPAHATVRDGLQVLSKRRRQGCLPLLLGARVTRIHLALHRLCGPERILRTSEPQSRASRGGLDFLRLSRRNSIRPPAMQHELRNLLRP